MVLFLELTQDLLAAGQSVQMIGTGLSMLPHLLPGCRVTIEPAPVSSLTLGDIVVFCDDGGRWVAHRLRAIEDQLFVAKGDARNLADRARPLDDLVGRVTRVRLGPLSWSPESSRRLFERLFGRADPFPCRAAAYLWILWRRLARRLRRRGSTAPAGAGTHAVLLRG